jgi:hypothetical protein
MSLVVRRVTDPAELQEVYRLRYRVYVEELGYPQRYADHRTGMVQEPLDETAHILGGFDQGRLAGTCRINFAAETDLGDYVELYRLRHFAPFFPRQVSVTTKGMMLPDYRHGVPCLQMILDGYRYLRAACSDICFDFIDAKPHLLPLHRKIGYRQVAPAMPHPEVGGKVHPLVLVVRDRRYFQRIQSPLAGVMDETANDEDDRSVRFFYDRFGPEEPGEQNGRGSPKPERDQRVEVPRCRTVP